MVRQLSRELLWTEAKDVWCCHLEPVWGDFLGARAVGQSRPVPFLDAFPLTLWLHMKTKPSPDVDIPATADIHGLAYISNLVSVQINHYQYLFLLRLSEVVSEMATYLAVDSNKILKVESGGSLVIGALIPQVEVTFVMPSQTPGKENSGGDLESVVPDSSSIADDLGGSGPWQSSADKTRVEFSSKRMNTSNDVETPQSEVSSSLSMDFPRTETTAQQSVVTFKQNGTEMNKPQSAGVEHIASIDGQSGVPSLKVHDRRKVESHSEQQQAGKAAQSASVPPFMPNNFNAGFSSMKKGFSNLMTSIDSALKPSPEDGSSDTVSMRSDASSDSENYIVVSLEEQERTDASFSVDNTMQITTVEEASEVVEETPDTQSERSMDSVCRRRDLVNKFLGSCIIKLKMPRRK